ncbi:MAG: helix-turn-helix domain-containing protein [Vicinamibacterales bacterium]
MHETLAVRSEWMMTVNACSQRFASVVYFDDGPPIVSAQQFLASLPEPVTAVERLVLRSRLFDIAMRWSETAHDRAHAETAGACAFSAAGFTARAWRRSEGDKAVFDAWATGFFTELDRAHVPPAERAARWIDAHVSAPLNVTALAREVGMHPVALRREFESHFDMSLRTYHVRARVARALQLLADERLTMRMVAAEIGYRSAKNFYRAIQGVTGRRLAELRQTARQQ